MSYFLTIDPGLGGTGYAVFKDDPKEWMPHLTGVIQCSEKQGTLWPQRQTEIMDKFNDNLIGTFYTSKDGWSIKKAYIELPAMFESAKGMACATGESGQDSSLVKLAVLVGRLFESLDGESIHVEFIRVNDWKGTLPKKVVSARIQERLRLPVTAITRFGDHACDAVGMGLYVKGVFKANTVDQSGEKRNVIPRKRNR